MSARRGRLAALLAVVGLVVSACSGVPDASRPQVVRSVADDGGGAAPPVEGPARGADARSIVAGFLQANASTDVRHTGARQFLVPETQRTWQDVSVTVVDGLGLRVGTFDPAASTVSVTARRVGKVEADGTYTPALRDTAGGVEDQPFTFGMAQVDGQWRIESLSAGLIVTEADFERTYLQYELYFFDSTESTLVPDLRYSATTGQSLATFLLDELLDGPRRPELQSLVSQIPQQPPTSRPTVTVGDPTDIALAGVRQLPSTTLPKVAAQLAYTLGGLSTSPLRILDSGTPVSITGSGDTFRRSDFPSYGRDQASAEVLYIRDGAIVSSTDGKPLPGRGGTGEPGLVSVASTGGDEPWLAAVGFTGGAGALYLGKDSASLTPVALPAGVAAQTLTRPSWASRNGEVWISDGAQLVRVARDGTSATVPILVRGGGTADGSISAVRMSRDGARVALIYGSGADQGLWVGSVVRSGADVRIEPLTQITPTNYQLTDVAWTDPAKLLVIGRRKESTGPLDFGIWAVQVDGSQLTPRSTSGLPSQPQSITAAPAEFTWVAVDGAVWELRGATWASPMAEAQVSAKGTNPAYGD